ncbi:hypothetical protein MRX96_001830 [Rhipicephalus microplus]
MSKSKNSCFSLPARPWYAVQESMEKYEDRRGKPRVLAHLLLLLVTLDAALCMDLSTHPSVGGWVQQNPNEPNLLAVARFAELSTAQPGGPRYRVLRVLSAWSQVRPPL